MLTSLSLIFLVGLAMGAICSRLKLPRILGMLATGIVLGPYVLDFLDPSILSISSILIIVQSHFQNALRFVSVRIRHIESQFRDAVRVNTTHP